MRATRGGAARRAAGRWRRAAWTPLRLAAGGAWHRPGRQALVALGVAAAMALLAGVVGGGTVAAERSVRAGIAALPPAERAVRLDWSGGYPPGTDARARSLLASFAKGGQTRTLLFRPLKLGGRLVQLAAIDPLPRWVRLAFGRLAGRCTAAHCEVVQIGGTPVGSAVRDSGLDLAVTGRGGLTSAAPLGFSVGAGGTPLLIGGDVRAFDRLAPLSSAFRVFGWMAPLVPDDVHAWALGDVRRHLERAQASVAAASEGFTLSAPDVALADLQRRARTASARLLIVGGEAAVLLLAFAVLAALGLRSEQAAEAWRLERRGARRWQLGALAVADAAVLTLPGALVGAAVGVGAVAWLAGRSGVDAVGVLVHSLLAPRGLIALLLAWGLAAGALLAARAARTDRGPRGGVRVGDVVALGAVGALALAAARGAAGASSLGRGGRVDPLLPLLPLLACLAAALLVVRGIGPLARLAERAARRAPVTLRLALLALARNPARPALTVAFLVVSLGTAGFAAAYRATLSRGQEDQAAFRAPADVIAAAGAAGQGPFALAPPSRYAALSGSAPTPVLRLSATVPGGGGAAQSVTALGLPAAAVAHLPGWRRDFAGASPAKLAGLLAPGGSGGAGSSGSGGAGSSGSGGTGPRAPTLAGPLVPAGARELSVRASTRGDAATLTARITSGVTTLSIPLGTTAPRPRTLRGRLPHLAPGARLIALEIAAPTGIAATLGHQNAESSSQPRVAGGVLTLGALRADGRSLTGFAGWVGRGGARAPRGGSLAFTLQSVPRTLIRPVEPTDGVGVPVVASPDLAARVGAAGTLPLSFLGQPLTGRVVATAERFPTLGESSFVVADEATLAVALEADAPGSAQPTELWLRSAHPAALVAALHRVPFSSLGLTSRAALLHTLRADPLARGVLATLAAAAALAAALALLGLALAAAAELEDERTELYDLEVQGVAPRALRRQLRVRAALLATLGVIGGLALAALLERFTVGLVRVSAGAGAPEPPLVTVGRWPLVALAAVALAAVALAGVAVLTRTAFRERSPRRPAGRLW